MRRRGPPGRGRSDPSAARRTPQLRLSRIKQLSSNCRPPLPSAARSVPLASLPCGIYPRMPPNHHQLPLAPPPPNDPPPNPPKPPPPPPPPKPPPPQPPPPIIGPIHQPPPRRYPLD